MLLVKRRDVLSADADLTALYRVIGRDQLENGGLSGAAPAYNGSQLTLRNPETDMIEYLLVIVAETYLIEAYLTVLLRRFGVKLLGC